MEAALEILSERTGEQRPLAGRTFVDVGANIGTSSIPAIKRFGARAAVALEPEPETFRLLKCNIAANDVEANICSLQLALSDRTGRAQLELSTGNWGDHRVRLGSPPRDGAFGEGARRCVDVAVARFDDMAVQQEIDIDELGMVWLDTQGHEGHVLAGAPSLLASRVPLVSEYWPYGLRRAGGLDLFHDLVAAHYGEVIDLRASRAAHSPVVFDAGRLRDLDHSLGLGHTDLLLLS